MAHQSKGADLAALLSESLQLDRNVLYRSRCATLIECKVACTGIHVFQCSLKPMKWQDVA